MPDFWEQFDISYRLFSHFCDPTDWHDLLRCIAAEFSWPKPCVSRQLLDIGAGNGQNTRTILEVIFASEGCRHFVTAVEPSYIARERLKATLLMDKEGGFLNGLYDTIHSVGNRKYDGILFLHSCYYIQDFATMLHRCYSGHLRQNGKIVIVTLAKESPLFFNLPPSYDNVAEEIYPIIKRYGWSHYTRSIVSRFRLPASIKLTDQSLKHLHAFFTHKTGLSFPEFKALFYKYLMNDKSVDLKDRLIVIEKRR